jgi:transcription elongation factor GreA
VKLKEKLEISKSVERRQIADRIKEAVEAGDITDSPAYESAREAQSMNEGRILELEDLLKRAVVIKKRLNSATVTIGSSVELRSGLKKMTFTIVGSEESDPAKGFISNESPLGQALLGKKSGDEVVVTNLLGKRIDYKIIKIY